MSVGRTLGDLGCVIGKGLLAGLAGTAALTFAQAVEMALTGRPASTIPADAVEKVLGIRATDEAHKNQLAQMVHWGYGSSWGLFRSLLDLLDLHGPAASLLHGAVIEGTALVMLPKVAAAPPPREWPIQMHLTEGVFHLVYATAAGAAYDLMSEKS